jgi:hypothetical protein
MDREQTGRPGLGDHVGRLDPSTHPATVQRYTHDCPHEDLRDEFVGHEVVEGAVDGRDVRDDPTDRRRALAVAGARGWSQASASAALRNASAWSVCSHVNVGSGRPKCPYAAVRR